MGYDAAIAFDNLFKTKVSKFLKTSVKKAVKFVTGFEQELARQAKKRGCHTVICGHIHHPEDKAMDGVRYMNTGDWIENHSYITYDKEKYKLHM